MLHPLYKAHFLKAASLTHPRMKKLKNTPGRKKNEIAAMTSVLKLSHCQLQQPLSPLPFLNSNKLLQRAIGYLSELQLQRPVMKSALGPVWALCTELELAGLNSAASFHNSFNHKEDWGTQSWCSSFAQIFLFAGTALLQDESNSKEMFQHWQTSTQLLSCVRDGCCKPFSKIKES